MNKLFLDTNIVLDLLAKREAYAAAARVCSLGDTGKVRLFVSALTFANTNYILGQHLGKEGTIKVLRDLELIVTIIDLSGKVVRLALNDTDFKDFEDGLQYYSALENEMDYIITRNLKDFRGAKIPVLTADQYLKLPEK
ncbi:PIN domain-containing protein [Neolewinella lacunae]|uniref:PIN domain-containing protein n=1 Tax=Neolewinella lacunae TaxID=1517758 RepID=A0A923PL79_9BACT|nr:PIN domain-containing protein [Neolewinella lacunae]MBC6993334.1 PIN domain-containing protein [Neolewinella lacunae]MDN3636324.1 PIN domain-containing protein [Neolewinella lacunae]